ncbi:structural protein P5 [Stenotrophomonas maltophilia]|uniref:structural protein P5 n=1 Tax=Stenotrophomonas maltophilia TaxID=40324 RepID=UPI00107630D2|nr:structural protein P5 [Stenotrophomonas maltophilia]TFZ46118.1 structural protein P5 [Stenotrophomonas maltophilia]
MTSSIPRGVRNNNPGNIDRSSVVWQGEDRSTEALQRERRFCVFLTPQAGFRALGKTLLTYQRKHGLRTVKEIINRWAPPIENDTTAYVQEVAKAVGVSPSEVVRLDTPVTLERLATAIAKHENGGLFWRRDVIVAGIAEALS